MLSQLFSDFKRFWCSLPTEKSDPVLSHKATHFTFPQTQDLWQTYAILSKLMAVTCVK